MVLRKKGGRLLNSPRAIGFTILSLSRTLMLELHYNYSKATYGDRATLHFTDTDSLLYRIKTENIIRDMVDAHQPFDIVEALTDDVLEELTPDRVKQ